MAGPRRLVAVLAVLLLGLLAGSGWLLWSLAVLRIEVAFAAEQTAIFEQMRQEALQGDARTAAGCLEYVVNYYPSGTKQRAGSKLDRLVERARALAVADIVAHLRRTTGEDLGDAPEPWVRKYAPRD